MTIPKIFGNRIILVVLALAMILVIIGIFISIGKTAFTGFASSDEQIPQENQFTSIVENTNGEPSLSIIVTENTDEGLTNPPDSSSPPTSQTKTSSSRRNSHSSRSPNSPNTNQDNYTSINPDNTEEDSNSVNPGNSNNQNPQTSSKKKLLKKPKNLDLKRNNLNINEGEEFQGIIRLNLEKSNRKISAFDIDFNEDIDISDITADSDPISGKVYMHSTSGLLENIDLYVPIKPGDDGVIVCSGASSYSQIYYGCLQDPYVNKEELLTLSNPRVELSSDGLYFIVHGITGTGAVGVNVTNISSSHQNATPPGSLDAFAGNVTEITTPEGLGITQAWAGYYGNISGTIQLADNTDKVMYNWSLASPEGQVFASINNSIVWNYIQCFNFTASGTYTDESGNGGLTNLHGTNLSILESQYNIRAGDLDGVDETFSLLGAGTHNTFYVNSNEFTEGECQNTRIFDSTGTGNDDNFEEVIMYEPSTYSVIFGALLNENVPGFDHNPHDFEMIVLEDGHFTDTETTIYYFYAVIF
ncbi:MAG: hypothetical protein ACP5NZ_02510 [Nanobdellota archaeon]